MPVKGFEYVDPCRCPECKGECTFKVPRKWFMCRPCVRGYHVGPCPAFVPQPFPRIQLECAECGYEDPDHQAA